MVPHGRLHIVLVPGFAGFDALGQLEYFAGVTEQFQAWQQGAREVRAVLHYFDNFPTAAVITRAGRLRKYLAKRIARREFQPGDALALVGHSTGGLDIRWLLWELTEPGQEDLRVDGVSVPAAEIFKMVRRIVFLSVPQWGTNIADWVRSYKMRAESGGRRTALFSGRFATAPAGPRTGLRAARSQFPDRLKPRARPAGRAQRGRGTGLWRRSVLHRGRERSGIRARSLAAPHGVGFSRHRRSGFAGAARYLP